VPGLGLHVVVELHLDILFHLLVIRKMQVVLIVAIHEIALVMRVVPAYLGSMIIDPALEILAGQVSALVFDIDVPVPILHKHGHILMAQIPSNIVVIIPVFRGFNGQGKIAAALSITALALVLF
jgi:hypothetical protein